MRRTYIKGDNVYVGEGQVKTLKFGFTQNAAEKDTGHDLPSKAVVKDVIVEVTTAVASSTINVGLLASESGGDADGFVAALATTSAGLKRATATVTTGTNTKYFSANTRGVLLSDYQAGTDVNGDEGMYLEKPHLSDSVTAKSVTYTTSAHAIVGNVYVIYWEPEL